MDIVRERPRLAAVRNALVSDDLKHGFWRTTGLVALVRLPPNSPFSITNVVLASVRVPRICFLLGTVAGMLPRTAVVVWIGFTVGLAANGTFPYPKWLFIAGIVSMLAVLGIIMTLADRAVKRMTPPGAKPADV